MAAKQKTTVFVSGYDCVRYAQEGELTPAEQERQKRVRLEAAERFDAAEPVTG